MSKIVAINKENGNLIIKNSGSFVTIDVEKKDVLSVDENVLISWKEWDHPTSDSISPLWDELAEAATTTLSIQNTTEITDPETKIFRVPKKVQAESLTFSSDTVSLQDIYGFVASGSLDTVEEHTKTWLDKVMENYPLTAEEPDNVDQFFYVYESEDSPFVVTGLFKLDDETWFQRIDNEWHSVAAPDPVKLVEIVDDETKDIVFSWADKNDGSTLELSNYFVEEFGIFNAAYAELDLEFLQRAFDIYDSQERSINAKKQVRGPGGKFTKNPGGAESTRETPVARLDVDVPLLENPSQRIDEYLKWVEEQRGGAAAPSDLGISAQAAGVPESDVTPLYLAIVDDIDTDAVLDVISLVPPKAGTQGDVTAWKRSNGQWIAAPEMVVALRGSTPPSVKELKDPELLKNVLIQVDKATSVETEDVPPPGETELNPDGTDANAPHPEAASARDIALGLSFSDGSLLIKTVDDLRREVHNVESYEQQLHVIKRARALNRIDLLPDMWNNAPDQTEFALWGPYGEILPLNAAGGADRNRGNAERLRHYWTRGLGGVKIGWRTPGDGTRCIAYLTKYLGYRARGYCQLRHWEMNGYYMGDRRNK